MVVPIGVWLSAFCGRLSKARVTRNVAGSREKSAPPEELLN